MNRKRVIIPLAGVSVLAIAAGVLWAYRTPIITRYVDRTLTEKGVRATYKIAHIGLRTQRLTDIVIGDPRHPDLVAREVLLTVDLGLSGAAVTSIKARGVRGLARWQNGRLSFGDIDKLLPQDDSKPIELPDYDVDVADSALSIVTPWGAMGIGADGHGNLSSGFGGDLAVRAYALDGGGCAIRSVKADVVVKIRSGAPNFSGPVGIGQATCDKLGIDLKDARLGVNVAVAPDFQHVALDSGIRTGRARLAGSAAKEIGGQIQTTYAADRPLSVQWDLKARQFVNQWASARELGLTGKGVLSSSKNMAIDGGISVSSGSVSPSLLRRIDSVGSSGKDTPVGPILQRIAIATRSAGRNVSGNASYSLYGDDRRPLETAVGDVALRSASGGYLDFAGERALGWGASRGVSLALNGRIGGGGLPTGRVQLSRAGTGSALRGQINLQPYSAGSAAIALAPVSFIAQPDGSARFTTGAALSGPMAGGFIDRLTMPIDGRVSPNGVVSLSGACTPVSWQSVVLGSMAINRNAVRLCGLGGQPLVTLGAGGVMAAARVDAFSLEGRVGSSPLHLASSGGRFNGDSGAFSLNGIDVAIGQGESATRFAAATLAGASGAGGLSGTMADASGKIGPVPFLISGGNGRWRYANRQLLLNTGLAVEDAADNDRFQPLLSDDVTLTFADNIIRASGMLREKVSGADVVRLEVVHDLGRSVGDASLLVPSIRFTQSGVQPVTISNLALGVIANAEGSVRGEGSVHWGPQGVTSSGSFTTDDMDFAAAFGPVQDLAGTIHFDDLINLHTAPGQTVTVGSINPGIEVTDGRIDYQLLSNNRVRIEGGRWPFANGLLTLQPALLDFSAEHPRRLVFDVQGIDAAQFLQRYEFENISATGIFDGVLPTVFDQDGGRVEGGSLVARDGGGTLAYVGEVSNHNLGYFGNMAFGALKSLRYDGLAIRMNGRIDGEMVTEVRFTGLAQGTGAESNFITRSLRNLPFTFNIRITAPFRQLLMSARGFYDPSVLIEQNLPTLLQNQRAAERARAEQPIQPSESEDRR